MASQKIETVTFYDGTTGNPFNGLAPTFAVYSLQDGTPVLPQPAITAIAGGGYKFTPVFALPDEVIYYEMQPNNVNALPAYYTRTMRREDWLADAPSVWEELTVGHTGVGTFGKLETDTKTAVDAINVETDAASIANAVWDVTTTGNIGVGTMGGLLGNASAGISFLSNGDTVNPIIVQVATPKFTQVKVTFSEPVVMTTGANGALNLGNYTIPGLTIIAAASISSQQVLLTTSAQTPNFLYTLDVNNVEDLIGNPIL